MSTEAPAPRPRRRLWTIVLVLSLALNLLVGGAIAARFFFPPPPERFIGASYAQLVPRKFLAGLDRARRGELLAVLRQYRDEFHDGRLAARMLSAELATALDTEPYDEEKVKQAVQAYAKTGNELVAHGANAALDFIAKLTPEERKSMAARLRERAGVENKD